MLTWTPDILTGFRGFPQSHLGKCHEEFLHNYFRFVGFDGLTAAYHPDDGDSMLLRRGSLCTRLHVATLQTTVIFLFPVSFTWSCVPLINIWSRFRQINSGNRKGENGRSFLRQEVFCIVKRSFIEMLRRRGLWHIWNVNVDNISSWTSETHLHQTACICRDWRYRRPPVYVT